MTTDLQRPVTVRPATVQWAANCLWVSAASALVATILEAATFVQVPGAPAGMSAVVGFITALFLAVMAATIGQGRNWARWVFGVVYIVGTVGSIVTITAADFVALPLVLRANMILQFSLQTAAFVLMLTGASRPWFRTR